MTNNATLVETILNKAITGYAGNCWHKDAVQACYAGLTDFDLEGALKALGIGIEHPDSGALYAAAQDEARKRAGEPVAEYREGDESRWQVFADGSLLERTNAARSPWADASDFRTYLLNDCGADEDNALVRFLDDHC